MGLYDRDYGRNDERSPWTQSQNPRSITVTLIIINVVVFLADMILAEPVGMGKRESILVPWFAVEAQTIIHPWKWFQFLTYGFLHDINGINHVLFNMIGLFFFGRVIEQRLGRSEFLKFYLVAIFAGGVIGSASNLIAGVAAGAEINQIMVSTIGASGAVVATVILFACFYPQQEILLFFVLPIKAWVLAVVFVGMDVAGAMGWMGERAVQSNTAFTVHLAGAGFALAYYLQRWSLKWLDLSFFSNLPQRLRQRSRRMKLKLHDPEKKIEQEAEEADRILAKITKSGEASLTASERKTLERYSRRQREKRNQE